MYPDPTPSALRHLKAVVLNKRLVFPPVIRDRMLKIQITPKSVHWHKYVTIKEGGRIWASSYSERETELEKYLSGP